MDQFESIRESATQLHNRLVAAGSNPLDPLALVNAAARELDLELAWLKSGDPALKGARALFDEQSGTICCEDVGEAAQRALLVAHEIGHVEVHAGSVVCTATDIDPSRSTEAAAVGLQRVEDYGARERKELQANVFAREFLLPRGIAKALHVEKVQTAFAIANSTGLPIALVRQQLFDALLLPSISAAAEEPPKSYVPRPDPSQDRAASHEGAPFQLQAGPGTGKTRTLIKRVNFLLGMGIDPAGLLVLTFSNRAASELSERLMAATPDATPRIWIGTFHAFGLDLVRRHHDRLGLPSNPMLFDRSDAIEVLEEILPTLPLVHYRNLWDPAMELREIISAISRAKDELVDPGRYRALADEMLRQATDEKSREAAEKCLEVAEIYDLYEKALHERSAVDFGDLIMRPALLLASDQALRAAVQLRHRHIMVDEYQDVNRASAKLLKEVSGDGKRLWVVGDSRQSIYRFRGASSANMVSFKADYPGAVVDQLELNYRSTSQIVSNVVALAPHMGASEGMLSLKLEADRGPGAAKPQIRRYDRPEDETEGVAACIRELESKGIRLRDQAVLCRSNKRLNEIAAALEARGIPVLHLGSLFERDEIRDLLALLSLAIDPFGDALVRIGAMPRYDLSLQDTYVTCRHLRDAGQPALKGLASSAAVAGLSAAGADGLKRLVGDLAGLAQNISAWDFLSTYLLDRTDLARKMAAATTVNERMRAVAVWQFLNFVREQGPPVSMLPIQRTLDRVRQLVLLAEERDLRQVPAPALHMDAVRLMTIHGSKGLEFEAVHVPGMTVASIPANRQGQRCPSPVGMIEGAENISVSDEAKRAHELEEQCLFFVAASRARTHLQLYLSRTAPGGDRRTPSPYLGWLAPGQFDEIAQPAQLPLPDDAPRPLPIEVVKTPNWSVTDSRLISYKSCPRRFFYTHVMGLRSARKATAFSRTHDCLYELIRWVAIARKNGEPGLEEATAAFEEIWQSKGPLLTEHAFAADYHRLALRLVGALIAAGAGRRFRNAEPLAIDFPNGRVVVEPHELAELPDGSVVIRRVRTGYRRKTEYDELEYALYQFAADQHFGPKAIVEAVHLSDETSEPVPTITARKLKTRHENSNAMLANIAAGQFLPDVDAVSCPRCPHFFVCAATPRGGLQLS